jgi:hypothetical protein
MSPYIKGLKTQIFMQIPNFNEFVKKFTETL